MQEQFGGTIFAVFMIVTSVFSALFYFQNFDERWTFPDMVRQAQHEDLPAFYRTAELIAEGRPGAAYDPQIFREGLTGDNKLLLMLNPPHFFLLLKPLANFKYGTVKAMMIAACLAAFAGLAYMSGVGWIMALLLATSGGAFFTFRLLNISLLIAVALTFALINAGKRPILSGMILALATCKPQYGVLVPVFLIACGHWRCLVTASLATGVLVAVSYFYFGEDLWQAYLNTPQYDAYQLYASVKAPGYTSVQSAVAKLGANGLGRIVAQILAIASCAVLIGWGSRRWPRQALIGITLIAAGAASPSLLYYSWPIMCIGLYFLLPEHGSWPASFQWFAGLLWCQPILAAVLMNIHAQSANAYSVFVTANIWVVLLLAIWLVEKGRREGDAAIP